LQPLSTVEDFYIEHQYSRLVWKDDAIENILWLQLLLPFTAVKNLYLCKEFAPGIVAPLQQRDLEELVGSRVTEVLPSLQNIVVEGLELWEPFQKNIAQLIAVRQLSGQSPFLSRVEEEEEEREIADESGENILVYTSLALPPS
jgi:hypothetical protein